jgi:hypothetical protein
MWACLFGQVLKTETTVFQGVSNRLVKVSVNDPLNRYVTGVEKEHLRFEDKVDNRHPFSQESALSASAFSTSAEA